MTRHRFYLLQATYLVLGLVVILIVMTHYRQIQNWLPQAVGESANLIIDTQGGLGKLTPSWHYFAQGGESPTYRFAPAQVALNRLKPKYVRVDHIFDFYEVVSRKGDGQLVFTWTKLDALISDITQSGALPYISLSYMPPAITQDGDITGVPVNWAEWQTVIQKTIEHVSGKNGLNLFRVYYEVWNEPDLFGNWKTYGLKNYLTLYEYASKGASAAKNVQEFKFGGPASTQLYENWVTRFIDYVVRNNLRFDFFSWHRYSPDPSDFLADYDRYDDLMHAYPNLILKVEPVISEWGIDSANNPAHDNSMGAAHLISVITTLMPRINKLFIFEFQDGLDPEGQEFWGRWGLVTHSSFNSRPKPRYQAIEFLNRLGPDRLSVIGNGTWVKTLAARSITGNPQLIISNYDLASMHVETVPLTFQRINPGAYNLILEFLNRPVQTIPLSTSTTSLSYSLTLPVNSVAYLELKPN